MTKATNASSKSIFGFNRNIFLYLVMLFVANLGFGIVGADFNLYILAMGLSPDILGVIFKPDSFRAGFSGDPNRFFGRKDWHQAWDDIGECGGRAGISDAGDFPQSETHIGGVVSVGCGAVWLFHHADALHQPLCRNREGPGIYFHEHYLLLRYSHWQPDWGFSAWNHKSNVFE